MTLAGRLRRLAQDHLTRRRDIEALYKVLYDQVHDLDESVEITRGSTASAFGRQWAELPEGDYLLSDPWFRENVVRILTEQELLLKPDWFVGKKILDAGCGNGRWSYGLSKLGADLTSVDINESALEATREALAGLGTPQRRIQTPLEELDRELGGETFDLVFSWGVVHHTVKFNKVLDNLASAVAPGGVLYLYLYGREGTPISDDLRVFRERVSYNILMTDEERTAFLKRKAKGDPRLMHSMHDIYAPLINRRFTFPQVAELLAARGFVDAERTIDHTEVFVRATRGDVDLSTVTLPKRRPPYWFEGKHV